MAERIPTAYRVPTGNRGTTGYRGTTGAGQAPAIPPQMQDVHVVNRPVT